MKRTTVESNRAHSGAWRPYERTDSPRLLRRGGSVPSLCDMGSLLGEVAKGTRRYEYFIFHASGISNYLESESALQTEMEKQPAPVAPLFLPPPLFLLEDGHWSLHQPRGEHLSSRSAKQARFQELFPQSP